MFEAAVIVCERQGNIAHALSQAGISFALSGSNATYAWIASIDESAVRQFRNVEFIIARQDIDLVVATLQEIELIASKYRDHVLFHNVATRHDRWADRAIFANELADDTGCRTPSLESSDVVRGMPVISLPELIEFQLSRWQLDDRVDLRDLINVELVDGDWLDRLRPELAVRLQELLATPDG